MKQKKSLPPIISSRPASFVPDPKDTTKSIQVGPQPVVTDGYTGKYHKISESENAEPYGLKILDEDEAAAHYGHTHHLINQEHFWTGTKEQFKEQFERS